MGDIENAWNNIRRLDELAVKKTLIHRLDPSAKLLTTLVYIVIVTSFPQYDLLGLLPLVLYPLVMISLGELPAGYLLRRLIFTAPFAFFIGVFNPLFDHTPLMQIGRFMITGGWVSFFSIMIRFVLTVIAAFILIATSGLNEIGAALSRLRVPRVFVIQLLFIYRYLSILVEETARSVRAYSLRDPNARGIRFKIWGSLVGQLLLRTVDRAQRIYQAMLCRGFTGEFRLRRQERMAFKDILYILGWACFFVIARLYNIPQLLGSMLMGVGR